MAWWNPRTWGRNKAKKRAAYVAATKGGRNKGFVSTSTEINTIIGAEAATLRARARDLARNNEHAAAAVRAYVSDVVGCGIRPHSDTGSDALDRAVDGLWSDWVY